MSKIKVGDKIRMLGSCFHGTDMEIGVVATVALVTDHGNFATYDPDGSEGRWHFNERDLDVGFELVEEKKHITIVNNFSTTNSEEIIKSIEEKKSIDGHYDYFYDLSPFEAKFLQVKLDPYKIASVWKLGEKDDTGCVFHVLKTIARFGVKNSKEREIKALHATIKRLAEIEGVNLE